MRAWIGDLTRFAAATLTAATVSLTLIGVCELARHLL